MDISTNDTSMQIITISAGGKEIMRRLAPQFGAYKYYKIGNISVKLVPASTLPVDPTGLSYTSGENTVDPRDQLTPGMMRITNGEDVFEDITGLSDDVQHAIYNNMLLDPRWFKWMLQSGVKRHATPRYWMIGQLHQDKWPGASMNIPSLSSDDGLTLDDTAVVRSRAVDGQLEQFLTDEFSSKYGMFQVGHSGKLGWLPTDGFQVVKGVNAPMLASPPEVEVMKIILPKAYKTRYYYRMFITETVYFREPIVTFGVDAGGPAFYRPLDVFRGVNITSPMLPSTPQQLDRPTDSETGGNYGNN